MDSFFSDFDFSHLVLALILFIATLVVIFTLLLRGSKQRRVAFMDRRRNREKLNFPFYDSDKLLVTEERRSETDRRKARSIRVANKKAAI